MWSLPPKKDECSHVTGRSDGMRGTSPLSDLSATVLIPLLAVIVLHFHRTIILRINIVRNASLLSNSSKAATATAARMKPSTIFPILTLALAPQSWAMTEEQQLNLQCSSRFPRINGAIEKFCYKITNGKANNDIVVPSSYAANGVKFYGLKGNQLQVRITGDCKPGQWLPSQYCLSQFYAMCASTRDPRGYNVHTFGNNGCQSFQIGGWVN